MNKIKDINELVEVMRKFSEEYEKYFSVEVDIHDGEKKYRLITVSPLSATQRYEIAKALGCVISIVNDHEVGSLKGIGSGKVGDIDLEVTFYSVAKCKKVGTKKETVTKTRIVTPAVEEEYKEEVEISVWKCD